MPLMPPIRAIAGVIAAAVCVFALALPSHTRAGPRKVSRVVKKTSPSQIQLKCFVSDKLDLSKRGDGPDGSHLNIQPGAIVCKVTVSDIGVRPASYWRVGLSVGQGKRLTPVATVFATNVNRKPTTVSLLIPWPVFVSVLRRRIPDMAVPVYSARFVAKVERFMSGKRRPKKHKAELVISFAFGA